MFHGVLGVCVCMCGSVCTSVADTTRVTPVNPLVTRVPLRTEDYDPSYGILGLIAPYYECSYNRAGLVE